MKKLLLFIGMAFIGMKALAQSAPSAQVFPTSAITNTSATINYNISSNGRATTVHLSIGKASGIGGFIQISSHNSNFFGDLTYNVTALEPNTTYFFTVRANNNLGVSNSNGIFTTASGLNNAENLIGKYRFSPSSIMIDESGNNHTLQASGSQALQGSDRLGTANSAALFNSFYKLDNTATQFKATSVSIAAWVYKTGVQTYSTIAGYRYNESFAPFNSYSLNSGSASANKLSFSISTAAANDLNITSNATLNLNTWYHVVATYNAANGSAKLYINGVLDNSATFTPASITYLTAASNNSFCIGAINYINNHSFIGTIDEVFVYGRSITQTEVTDLYNSTYLSNQDFNTANLKASIYPNPATDNFVVEIENELKSIEIYSLQGQKVLTTTDKTVGVSNLSKGMYLVRIEDENNAIATKKLIIE